MLVKNKTDKDIILVWNGIQYMLPQGLAVPLPEEVRKAFFPLNIEEYLPAGTTLLAEDLIRFLNIFRGRWEHLGFNISSENFLEFIHENFEFLEEEKEEKIKGISKIKERTKTKTKKIETEETEEFEKKLEEIIE